MKPQLKTARLDLQVFTLTDAASLHRLFSDPLTHTIGAGAFTKMDQTTAWIQKRLDTYRTLGLAWYAVRIRGDDRIVGNCGLLLGRKSQEEPEIGYEIAATERGHGYASEAAAAVVAEGRSAGLARLWATVRPANTPSLRIVDRLGFLPVYVEDDERGPLVHLSKDLTRS